MELGRRKIEASIDTSVHRHTGTRKAYVYRMSIIFRERSTETVMRFSCRAMYCRLMWTSGPPSRNFRQRDATIAQVYVDSPDDAPQHTVLKLADGDKRGAKGERYCWYQCTVKGGREGRDIDAIALSKVRNDEPDTVLQSPDHDKMDLVRIQSSKVKDPSCCGVDDCHLSLVEIC